MTQAVLRTVRWVYGWRWLALPPVVGAAEPVKIGDIGDNGFGIA